VASDAVAHDHIRGLVEGNAVDAVAVRDAVDELDVARGLAGGLDFVGNNQTVVLKPNLLKTRMGFGMTAVDLAQTANGVTTDYRVVKVVAELVRERNPDGRVIVLEGSVEDTSDATAFAGPSFACP
jgi:uncharacterized protein (DUF362 family)